MMKMRQPQLLEDTSITISKQKALFLHNQRPSGNEHSLKGGFTNMAISGADDYERDESPVSVISHSATIVSQPSSSCTSMDHHLNYLISNPSYLHRQQRMANPIHQCPALSQEQLSMCTSAASTSEDDGSSIYNLPTLSIAVSPKQEELSQEAQKHNVYSRKGILRRSITNQHCSVEEVFTQKTSTKASKTRSQLAKAGHTTDSFNSDDDEHMISIDLQGVQEDPMVLRGTFLRNHGNNSKEENDKHEVGKISTKSKHYNALNDQKLNRSSSSTQKEIASVISIKNSSASTVESRAGATLNVIKYEGTSKWPQKSAKASNTVPFSLNRQQSINSTRLVVPSKWDDAGRWLSYDNHHVAHHNQEKGSSGGSRQTSHDNYSTPSNGGIVVASKQLIFKEGHASPSWGNLSVNDKTSGCRNDQSHDRSRAELNVYEAHESKNNLVNNIYSKHSMLQDGILTSAKGAQCRVDVTSSSGSKHACASESSSSNELAENSMLTSGCLDTSKHKWNEAPRAKACQKSDYMSSGEIGIPRFVRNGKFAVTSMSDGEFNRVDRLSTCQHSHNIASQTSSSTGSMLGEKKAKYNIRPASNGVWFQSKSDAIESPCECEHLSCGEEIMCGVSQQNVVGESCASENYASNEESKSNGSNTWRFRQPHLLQKLKRKCSPKQGNAGAYVIAPESAKAPVEEVGGDMARAHAGTQKEFVVQTPTHGRSASMKDACTEVSPSLSRRDVGTQMTPTASSPNTSKCTTPLQNTSPARHNTPTRTSPAWNQKKTDINTSRDSDDGHRISRCNLSALELESCHWAKLELRELPSGAQTSEKNSDLGSVCNDWSPANYGLEEDIVNSSDADEVQCAKDETDSGGIIMNRSRALESRAAAWEEAERAKCNAKYKREEARIRAWENSQKVKAEADLKKLEVKLERLRSKVTDKVLSKMAAAEKRAEEMRAVAEAQQQEQMRKVRERARNLRRHALFPGSFAVCFARNYRP